MPYDASKRRAGRIWGMEPTSEEEIELDRLSRKAFNQPLPMLGAPDIARAILNEHLNRSVRGIGNAPHS